MSAPILVINNDLRSLSIEQLDARFHRHRLEQIDLALELLRRYAIAAAMIQELSRELDRKDESGVIEHG